MQKLSAVITDDHPLFRESLQVFLSSHTCYEVVGQCETGEEAIELATRLQPDVMIMDMRLPGISGAVAAAYLRKKYPAMQVIGVSMSTDSVIRRQFNKAGVEIVLDKVNCAEYLSATSKT